MYELENRIVCALFEEIDLAGESWTIEKEVRSESERWLRAVNEVVAFCNDKCRNETFWPIASALYDDMVTMKERFEGEGRRKIIGLMRFRERCAHEISGDMRCLLRTMEEYASVSERCAGSVNVFVDVDEVWRLREILAKAGRDCERLKIVFRDVHNNGSEMFEKTRRRMNELKKEVIHEVRRAYYGQIEMKRKMSEEYEAMKAQRLELAKRRNLAANNTLASSAKVESNREERANDVGNLHDLICGRRREIEDGRREAEVEMETLKSLLRKERYAMNENCSTERKRYIAMFQSMRDRITDSSNEVREFGIRSNEWLVGNKEIRKAQAIMFSEAAAKLKTELSLQRQKRSDVLVDICARKEELLSLLRSLADVRDVDDPVRELSCEPVSLPNDLETEYERSVLDSKRTISDLTCELDAAIAAKENELADVYRTSMSEVEISVKNMLSDCDQKCAKEYEHLMATLDQSVFQTAIGYENGADAIDDIRREKVASISNIKRARTRIIAHWKLCIDKENERHSRALRSRPRNAEVEIAMLTDELNSLKAATIPIVVEAEASLIRTRCLLERVVALSSDWSSCSAAARIRELEIRSEYLRKRRVSLESELSLCKSRVLIHSNHAPAVISRPSTARGMPTGPCPVIRRVRK